MRAASLSGATLAESYEAMLADPAVEAVALVTPNHLHAAQAALAAGAGKHLFVEKPVAVTTAEAKRMLGLYRGSGRVMTAGHNTRRRQVFRRARTIIGEGHWGGWWPSKETSRGRPDSRRASPRGRPIPHSAPCCR